MGSEPADLDFCYLTTTGRVSGRPHRIEIWFGVRDAMVYLLSGGGERSDWVRNLMAQPEVALELGGRKRTTTARIIAAGSDEDGIARQLLVDKYQARGSGDLAEWGRTATVVAVAWPADLTYTSLV